MKQKQTAEKQTYTWTHLHLFLYLAVYRYFKRNLSSYQCFQIQSPICCCCSVAKQRLTLCDTVNCSTPGFPVLHYLPKFAQIHVHWVSDAIQPSHPLFPPSPLALNLSKHHIFSNESALWIRWPRYWSFSWSIPMNIQGWFSLGLTDRISLLSKGFRRVFSSTTVRKHRFFGTQPSLWLHDYWKNHSFDYMDLCQESDVFAF